MQEEDVKKWMIKDLGNEYLAHIESIEKTAHVIKVPVSTPLPAFDINKNIISLNQQANMTYLGAAYE